MYNSIDMEELILDLGCGNKKREGTIGVDFNTRLDGDVNHDLNQFYRKYRNIFGCRRTITIRTHGNHTII